MGKRPGARVRSRAGVKSSMPTTPLRRRTQAPVLVSTLSPPFAAVLSAVMPGLGQLYNRDGAKAAAILCSTFGIWAGLAWTTVGPEASRSWLSAGDPPAVAKPGVLSWRQDSVDVQRQRERGNLLAASERSDWRVYGADGVPPRFSAATPVRSSLAHQ